MFRGVFRAPVARIAAAVAVAGLLVACSGDAPALPAGNAYLALGDSLGTGVGASDPGTRGYVPLVTNRLGGSAKGIQLVNLSVSGETSVSLVADGGQLAKAIDEINKRKNDGDDANNVGLITLDIGGNDVAALIPACRAGFSPECVQSVGTTLAAFTANFDGALGQLRQAAGADTTIVVMTYFNSLAHPDCPSSAVAELGEAVIEGGGQLPAGLNDIVRSTAAKYSAKVAETHGQLGATELNGDCLHANDAGHAKIADAFVKVAPAAAD